MLGGACVRYHPAPIIPEAALESFEARRLADPALGDFLQQRNAVGQWPPAPSAWRLPLLTLAAFYFSPTLDVARARWAVARGGVLTAGGRTSPTLTGGLGYNSSTPDDGPTPWIPEVALDLPLDIAGRRGLRINQARQLSEAARLNLLTAAWAVRSRVRGAYLDLYLAQGSDSLLSRQATLQGEIVRILEGQLAAGEVSPFTVTQGRLQLGQTRLAALETARQSAQARGTLAEAIGVAPAALDDLALDFADVAIVDTGVPAMEVRRRAMVNRSDIRASLATYEASQEALRLEIRKQYPDVRLGPGYQLDQTDSKWTLSLSLPLPFVNRNRGPIAEALARREAAAAEFLALQSRVLTELEGAVRATRFVLAQARTADSLLQGIQRQERVAEGSFRAGEISRLELLTLQSELVTTALARLEATRRAQASLGALEDAMQSPLDMEAWTLVSPRSSPPRTGEQR